jgi:hypothetical protein
MLDSESKKAAKTKSLKERGSDWLQPPSIEVVVLFCTVGRLLQETKWRFAMTPPLVKVTKTNGAHGRSSPWFIKSNMFHYATLFVTMLTIVIFNSGGPNDYKKDLERNDIATVVFRR